MKTMKTIRVGGVIYRAGDEVDVGKEDVPAFQALGFRRARSKPVPKPIEDTEVDEIQTIKEEEKQDG